MHLKVVRTSTLPVLFSPLVTMTCTLSTLLLVRLHSGFLGIYLSFFNSLSFTSSFRSSLFYPLSALRSSILFPLFSLLSFPLALLSPLSDSLSLPLSLLINNHNIGLQRYCQALPMIKMLLKASCKMGMCMQVEKRREMEIQFWLNAVHAVHMLLMFQLVPQVQCASLLFIPTTGVPKTPTRPATLILVVYLHFSRVNWYTLIILHYTLALPSFHSRWQQNRMEGRCTSWVTSRQALITTPKPPSGRKDLSTRICLLCYPT
jgi:hypothetical protein